MFLALPAETHAPPLHSARLVSSRLASSLPVGISLTILLVQCTSGSLPLKTHSTCKEHGLTRYKYRIILAVLHSSKFRLMHYCNSSMRHQAITQSFPAIFSQTHRSILSLLAANLLLLWLRVSVSLAHRPDAPLSPCLITLVDSFVPFSVHSCL